MRMPKVKRLQLAKSDPTPKESRYEPNLGRASGLPRAVRPGHADRRSGVEQLERVVGQRAAVNRFGQSMAAPASAMTRAFAGLMVGSRRRRGTGRRDSHAASSSPSSSRTVRCEICHRVGFGNRIQEIEDRRRVGMAGPTELRAAALPKNLKPSALRCRSTGPPPVDRQPPLLPPVTSSTASSGRAESAQPAALRPDRR